MTHEQKQQAAEALARRYAEQSAEVAYIEPRLATYYDGLTADPAAHNAYEILGALKFLRLLRTYPFNHKRVRQVIRLREGEWQQDKHGKWQHVSGGIRQPLTSGDAVLRWEPFQVMILAYIFGPQAWIDTELPADERAILPTERINSDTGHIEDLRRLCVNFTLFGPRKIDKTGISAFISQVFFLLEDNNSEVYCTANSSDQSKILFRRIRHGLSQLDDGKRIRMTETVCDWRSAYQNLRQSSIRPLSAGGKTKDGMFAQLCCADEYGSASYTNNKCDMKRLVDVTESSMGPRREPLTIITTTAGRITAGPFIEKLDSLHRMLEAEMLYETGEAAPLLNTDRISCICLEPDEWEKENEEELLTSKAVRRKINPMLGKIVQHSFYDDEVAKARMDGDLGEVKSKLFNVYDSATVRSWLRSEMIRPLQTDLRITDCRFEDGWNVFVGMDFSDGDDLFAVTYLGVNYTATEQRGRFFVDCDAWVLEEAMDKSPNRELYKLWAEKGHLHICPGAVFQPMTAISALMQKQQAGVNMVSFGYDAAKSIMPINHLKAWLQSLGISAEDIERMVIPVRQTSLVQNPRVEELEYLIKSEERPILFSNNPLWPWCVGNVAVESNTSELKRLIKRAAGAKIDPVAALENALYLFDLAEGNINNG